MSFHIVESQSFQIYILYLFYILAGSRRSMIISLIPARLAASIFSLMPPTGSTLPRSVISPVMARLAFTFLLGEGRSEGGSHRDTGRRSVFQEWRLRAHGHGCSSYQKYLRQDSADEACALMYSSASIADSFITSPKLPVNVKRHPYHGSDWFPQRVFHRRRQSTPVR